MKLVRCRKCDTVVMSDDTLMESLIAQMNEANNKAVNGKPSLRNAYVQQSAQLSKIITQVQHRITQMEERKGAISTNLWLLKKHVIEQGIMSYEQLDTIEAAAVVEADKRNLKDSQDIEKLYGSRPNSSINRTKRDDTAKKALRNICK